jgi:primosomal protein N' (replication factor Y)
MPVARIALPVAAATLFDYWIPDGLDVERGALVRVKLGRRSLIGVVNEIVDRSEIPHERLQPIADALRELPPLPEDLLELAALSRLTIRSRWASSSRR